VAEVYGSALRLRRRAKEVGVCGIAGLVTFDRNSDRISVALETALGLLIHRGPDSLGMTSWASDGGARIDLGMTRLAVLDLSEAAEQPMSSSDGRFTLVYNGEITNFRELRSDLVAGGYAFRSSGDTEVLLGSWEAWGIECLAKLEGMYAFAILDRHEQALTLCRDSFGIKPLYYRQTEDLKLAFASEISSLLSMAKGQPKLNWAVAAHFLASGICDMSKETFIEGVFAVRPGEVLRVCLESGDISHDRPSWFPAIETQHGLSRTEAAQQVRSLVLASVKRNLRADVPIGIPLSGGLDSSTIAFAVRAVAPEYPLRLFTFAPSQVPAQELPWASAVADHLDIELHVIRPSHHEFLADTDRLIRTQGEPFGSTSIYAQFRVFQTMREQGIVVSLDGQGADEVFGGYHGYPGYRMRSLLETKRWGESLRYMNHWRQFPDRSLLKGVFHTGAALAPQLFGRLGGRILPGFALPGVDHRALGEQGAFWAWPSTQNDMSGAEGARVKTELRASLTTRGLQALLRHADRNSMHFSVENRVPFLDKSLVDYTLSLPENWLVGDDGTTKSIFRDAVRSLVPDAIIQRRDKVGFEGDEHWIQAHHTTMVRSIRDAPDIGFLDKRKVLEKLESSSRRGRVSTNQLWRVFNLYRWMELLDVQGT